MSAVPTTLATPPSQAARKRAWGPLVLAAVLLLGLLSAFLGQDPGVQSLDQSLAAPGAGHWLWT